MENYLAIWNKYKEVPKNALKAFDNGTFKGTDINTMWRLKCLTEEFGPCGLGWYPELVDRWTEIGMDGELLCFVEIKLYVKYNGEWSKGMSATGGSKLVSNVKSKGYLKNSDEGYKMAFTDAIGVACKYLGIGADVYWEHDKTKYTDTDGAGTETKSDGKDDLTKMKPTPDQIKELKKVNRTIASVAKKYNIKESEVTAQHAADYIAEVAKFQREKEEKKMAEVEKEALKTFGADGDNPDYTDPEWQ